MGGGRNQEGAVTTIGEEVEQVNSFLFRAAICSKYMAKAGKHFSCIVVSKLRPQAHIFLFGFSVELFFYYRVWSSSGSVRALRCD